MPDWQERITRDTEPAIRLEHELRYRAAMPIVHASGVWCDLGCGTGIAAAAALGGRFEGRALLVDADGDAVEGARGVIDAREMSGLVADLSNADGVAAVRAALRAGDAGAARCVTCFEVIEHLSSFAPLIDLLVALAEDGEATTVLSVPNDAFWTIENPYHRGSWSEGSFEELRRLLPGDHVVASQVALTGSALLVGDGGGAHALDLRVNGGGPPTHLLAAFGPQAHALAAAAAVGEVPMDDQRRWAHQRESDLAHLEAEVEELRGHVRESSERFAEWRSYIHELEERLGLPRSGDADDTRPTRQTDG